MAEVFLARAVGPMGFERRVVVKRILPHLSRDEEFVQMFVEEAKISAALSHGNIVHVYDFGEVDGQLFLAMEHVDGADLRGLVRRAALAGVRIPPELATFLLIEVLSALAYAHDRVDSRGRRLGLVHRDVSPSNILLSLAGEVKLCDFGIAKIAARHTSTGRLKGKFGYMSPEQANGEAVDARSDLWSAGVVLWEMVVGRKLFQADSDVGVLGLVCRAAVPELPPLGVPNEAALRAVIARALTRDPARRYQDATTMAEDLRDYLVDARLPDPSRSLRDLVGRFPTPPVGAPPRRISPEAPTRSAIGDGPTALLVEPGSAPSRSAVVPVRRLQASTVMLVLIALAVLAMIVVALWPSGSAPPPAPHSTPGWSPSADGRINLPPLPPLPPRMVPPPSPSTSTSTSPSPSPSPSTRDEAPSPSLSPSPSPSPPDETPSPHPRGWRPRPAGPATPDDVQDEPPPRPRPPSSREGTVDPFAL